MADATSKLGDALFGGVMLVLAVVVFATAWQLPPSLFDPLGPGAFPLLVSGLMALLALILLGRLALGLATGRSATTPATGRSAATTATGRSATTVATVLRADGCRKGSRRQCQGCSDR